MSNNWQDMETAPLGMRIEVRTTVDGREERNFVTNLAGAWTQDDGSNQRYRIGPPEAWRHVLPEHREQIERDKQSNSMKK
jgi:hypothetical protein